MHLPNPNNLPARVARRLLPLLAAIALLLATQSHGAMLYKDYLVRYDRGWDILCDPYQVQQGDWVLKIFRQKGEIAHDDFREFLGIFERLNPHVKDIDRIRPGQVVDIPLMKLAQGNLPGQASGVVTIPFVMINDPVEMIDNHTRSYTVKKGDTVSTLIAKQFGGRYGDRTFAQGLELFKAANPNIEDVNRIYAGQRLYMPDPSIREQRWYSTLFDESDRLTDPAAVSDDGTDPGPPPSSVAPVATRSATTAPAANAPLPGTDTAG
ncbi:MAG: LysM domain-containing protein, partial [Desulfosarcina sp.]